MSGTTTEFGTEGAADEPETVPPPPVTSADGTARLDESAVAPAPVEVADAGSGAGEVAPEPRRRRTRVRTSPLRTLGMALLAVAVTAGLAGLGLLAASTIANSREGRAVVADVPVSRLPSTPASLVVGLDRQGRPVSLTVLSVGAGGTGGTALVLPIATAAYLDGPAKPVRLDAAWDRGGLEAQTRGVESVLGISTTASAALDEDGLTQLLDPYAPVDVTLDTPVLDTAADGTTVELFPAGDVTLTARDAARLLLARVDGESELSRLPRAEALWAALLADGSAAASPATTVAGQAPPAPADVAGFLAAVTSGPAGTQVLRVQPSFDPADPTAPELLQADVAFLRLLVASVMPGAVSPSNGNISFRVVYPAGDQQGAYQAIGRLAAVQANVVLATAAEGPVPDVTTVVWHSPAGEAQAVAFAPVLGAGAPTASEERIDGIDATVVLGKDFAAFMAAEEAKVAATSTTTLPPTSTTAAPPTKRTTATTTKATTRTTTKKGKG